MKRMICVAAAVILSTGASFAASLNGGSVENNYVAGQSQSAVETSKASVEQGFYLGDGSKSNNYVQGQQVNSPLDQSAIRESVKGSLGRGTSAQ